MMAAPPTTTAMISTAAVLLYAAALLGAAEAAGGRHHKATAPAAAGDRLVAVACANMTTSHRYGGPGLTRDFCEITLWSDKRAASAAHPRDLALVAMDLVRDGAAGAAAKVGGALGSGSGGAAAAKKLSRDAALNLRYCQLDYEAVARTVPVCRAMVQEYDPAGVDGEGSPMIPFNYLECANRVVRAARDCWDHMLNGDEMKKAVWKEVSEVATRANLAKAMVEQMLGVVDDTDHDAADDDDDDDNHHDADGNRVIDDDDDDDDDHHVVVHSHHVIDDDDDDDDDNHHVVVHSHHVIDDGSHHVVDDDDDD